MNIEPKKKIIIIGAGISGITSGIYGQLNGYDTEIYEKNPNPGGLCVSWVRKGSEIDGCIHWLTGTMPGTEMNFMWKDVHAFNDEDIIRFNSFGTLDFLGKKIELYTDLNKLQNELIEYAPEDEKLIKKSIKRVLKFQNMGLPVDSPLSTMSIWRFIEIGFREIPYLYDYISCSKQSILSYANRFKSPLMKFVISHIIGGRNNTYSALYAFGTSAVQNGGVMRGGSSKLVENMVNRYLELGGKIHYCSEVESLIKDKKQIKAIKLKNGQEIAADYFITACDMKHTLTKLMGLEKYDRPYNKRFNNPLKYPCPTCVYASYRVSLEEVKRLRFESSYEFDCEPFECGASTHNTIKFHSYGYDDTFTKDGKTLITVLINQYDEDYNYWKNDVGSRADYVKTKEELNKIIIDRLIKKFPTLSQSIEHLDMATPLTYERYTHSYHGSYMPFAYTSNNQILMHKGKIFHYKNLFLSSQWTMMPGGLPIALMTGKFAIQRILKSEKKFFKLTKRVNFKYSM